MALEIIRDQSNILTVGIADNSLSGPAEAIKYTLEEMRKAGHKAIIYTYHIGNPEALSELAVFIKDYLGVEGWEPIARKDVEADVYFDEKNYGGSPGWFSLYGGFLRSELIAATERNKKIFTDREFWITGKESSGIITEQNKVGKIILPGRSN